MGTNFYWKDAGPNSEYPESHIGKRSAAGAYCWDCNETLCSGGKARIHYGDTFLAACPSCGKTRGQTEGLSKGPVAVELGFADPATDRPSGVCGAASFTWAQNPKTVRRTCRKRRDEILIVDEYGRELTGTEFLAMLAATCPIEFTDSIGVWFC